jgi:hypothetical protein
VIGTDHGGAIVASFQLRVGTVPVDGWDAPTLGREIDIELAGTRYPRWGSAGLGDLQPPIVDDPTLAAFVLDPYVAGVLARWGITYQLVEPAVTSETAYGCWLNSGTYVPPCSGQGGTASYCHEDWGDYGGYYTYEQKVVCNNGFAATRYCNTAGGPTPCGTAGPGGCAACGGGFAGATHTSCTGGACAFCAGGNCWL